MNAAGLEGVRGAVRKQLPSAFGTGLNSPESKAMSRPTVNALAPSARAARAARPSACTRTSPKSVPKRCSKNSRVPASSGYPAHRRPEDGEAVRMLAPGPGRIARGRDRRPRARRDGRAVCALSRGTRASLRTPAPGVACASARASNRRTRSTKHSLRDRPVRSRRARGQAEADRPVRRCQRCIRNVKDVSGTKRPLLSG